MDTTKLNLQQLFDLLSPEMVNSIKDSARRGDPEWLTDMIGELDYVPQTDSPSLIKGFHDVLHAMGITSAHFDEAEILRELDCLAPYDEAYATKRMEEDERASFNSEEEYVAWKESQDPLYKKQ